MAHTKQPSVRKFKGFTLIELIVVITILAILGTIGFLSIGGYSSKARDSARIGDAAQISKSLDLSIVTAGDYPAPDNAFGVTYSGGIVWYQGTIGSTVMQVFRSSISGGGLNKKPTDPLTNKEYTYSELAEGKAYQIKVDYEGDLNQTALDTSLVNEAIAAPGSPTIAYIRGNYGGLTAKVSTGGIVYVLALPSIITSTGTTVTGSITTNALSGTLLFHGRSLVNASTYNLSTRPNGGVVFTGSTLPVNDTTDQITNMITALKVAYSGSDIIGNSSIANLLSTTGSTIVKNLGATIVKDQLGGSTVSSGGGGGGSADTSPPTGGSFTMPTSVNTTSITLSVTCPVDASNSTPISVAYGNSSGPTNWTTCTSSISHTLTTGDGTKTVYVRFRDSVGNMTGDVSRSTELTSLPVCQGANSATATRCIWSSAGVGYFNVPSGTTEVEVLLIGAGGAGYSCSSNCLTGGGAGGSAIAVKFSVSGGERATITVPSGGVPSVGSYGYGTSGGSAIFSISGSKNANAGGGGYGGPGSGGVPSSNSSIGILSTSFTALGGAGSPGNTYYGGGGGGAAGGSTGGRDYNGSNVGSSGQNIPNQPGYTISPGYGINTNPLSGFTTYQSGGAGGGGGYGDSIIGNGQNGQPDRASTWSTNVLGASPVVNSITQHGGNGGIYGGGGGGGSHGSAGYGGSGYVRITFN